MSLFQQDITTLKGVGEKRAELFRKLDAPTVGALLRMYPRAYEDWSSLIPVRDAVPDEPCTVRGTVIQPVRQARIRKGLTIYRTKVSDGDMDLHLTFFNNQYLPNLLLEGETYLFHGKVTGSRGKREMSAPDFIREDQALPLRPVYRQTEGLSSRQITAAVKNAFQLLPETIYDPIPQEIRKEYGLCHLRYALQQIHFPESQESLGIDRNRLIFEELLILQLGLLRMKSIGKQSASRHTIEDHSEEFWSHLPFSPTGAQRRAVQEALSDMCPEGKKPPMNRLIQGDVGSGKTAVAAALCHSAVKSGKQAAMMVPTEILAQQHEKSLRQMLEPAGIRVALLSASLKAAEKRTVLSALEEGEIDVLVGTHALIGDQVQFRDLALVITDEQHRFGVRQRAALLEKGEKPHHLIMSATPIPRTLALMIYGDLDLSVLDELPPGRQKIETYAIDRTKRQRAFSFVRKHIEKGYQCYIICPLIEDSGDDDMASVTEYAEMLRHTAFPDLEIGILHGRMKAKEKDEVMQNFSQGDIPILVSTTVVEVGVDVPNAVLILIENAERYGLSQLHQLRGRVGRGSVKSTCILISDAKNEEAVQRLRVMCSTSDGFQVADEDLRLRGPGDFFGTNQHGLPALRIADMAQDFTVLKQAQQAARQILRTDPALTETGHRGLRSEVAMLFSRVGVQGLN